MQWYNNVEDTDLEKKIWWILSRFILIDFMVGMRSEGGKKHDLTQKLSGYLNT